MKGDFLRKLDFLLWGNPMQAEDKAAPLGEGEELRVGWGPKRDAGLGPGGARQV